MASQATGNLLVAGFHSRDHLPHLKKESAAYFVTFRLAGTLPKEVLLKFKAEREAILADAMAAKRPLTWHEQEELFRWYSARVDKYLDAGSGECWLKQPAYAEMSRPRSGIMPAKDLHCMPGSSCQITFMWFYDQCAAGH